MLHIFIAKQGQGKTSLANTLKTAGVKHVYDDGYPAEKPADFPADIHTTPVFIFRQQSGSMPNWLSDLIDTAETKLQIREITIASLIGK